MQYNNLNHLWHSTLKTIMNQGNKLDSRAGNTKEILGFQTILTNPLNNILLRFPERKFSLSYACAELLWYLSGTDFIDVISAYAPSYSKFAENGIAFGAYGNRWKSNPGYAEKYHYSTLDIPNGQSQLGAIIHLLKEKPNTRQAIMTMWDSGDLIHAIIGDHKDLPCTLTLKFYVRNSKLHLIADMRSNDAWLGLPYDIFCFTTLQYIIANELNLELGSYIHQAGSEHLYERNFEKVNNILKDYWPESYNIKSLPDNSKHSLESNIRQALRFEKEIRNTHASYKDFGQVLERGLYPVDNLFHDLVAGCATRWLEVHPNHFYNPLFQEWTKTKWEDQ